MKKLLILVLAILLCAAAVGCGTLTLHCANCGKEIKVSKNSGVDESWIVYCDECEKDLSLDDVIQARE